MALSRLGEQLEEIVGQLATIKTGLADTNTAVAGASMSGAIPEGGGGGGGGNAAGQVPPPPPPRGPSEIVVRHEHRVFDPEMNFNPPTGPSQTLGGSREYGPGMRETRPPGTLFNQTQQGSGVLYGPSGQMIVGGGWRTEGATDATASTGGGGQNNLVSLDRVYTTTSGGGGGGPSVIRARTGQPFEGLRSSDGESGGVGVGGGNREISERSEDPQRWQLLQAAAKWNGTPLTVLRSMSRALQDALIAKYEAAGRPGWNGGISWTKGSGSGSGGGGVELLRSSSFSSGGSISEGGSNANLVDKLRSAVISQSTQSSKDSTHLEAIAQDIRAIRNESKTSSLMLRTTGSV